MSRQSNLHSDPANAAERLVTLAATTGTTALVPETHANKLLTISLATSAVILTLPRATGSGDVYTIRNLAATGASGSLVINIAGGATINGVAFSSPSAAAATDEEVFFMTNADTITLNGTTTGGLGGDKIELIDIATNSWVAELFLNCSGNQATPFTT